MAAHTIPINQTPRLASERDPLLGSIAEEQPAHPNHRLLTLLRLILSGQAACSLVLIVLLVISLFTQVLFKPDSLLALAYVALGLAASVHTLLFFRTATPVQLTWILLGLLTANVALAAWPKVQLQLQTHGLAALGWTWVIALIVVLHAHTVRMGGEAELEPADDVSVLASSGLIDWVSVATTSIFTSLLSLAALLLLIHLIFSV